MEVKPQPKLKFKGVDIRNVNFSWSSQPNKESKIQIKVSPFVFFPKDGSSKFFTMMDVEIIHPDSFEIRLLGVGKFEIGDNLDSDTRVHLINRNAPAVMFPYIRAFVSTFSSNLGKTTGTITIPTQFFGGILNEWAENS